jgi:hypothetical protein
VGGDGEDDDALGVYGGGNAAEGSGEAGMQLDFDGGGRGQEAVGEGRLRGPGRGESLVIIGVFVVCVVRAAGGTQGGVGAGGGEGRVGEGVQLGAVFAVLLVEEGSGRDDAKLEFGNCFWEAHCDSEAAVASFV